MWLGVSALVAIGCSPANEATPSSDTADSTTVEPVPTTSVPPATTLDGGPTTTTQADQAEPTIIDDAEVDWGVPSVFPNEPTGALGFSRYVFVRDDDGDVVPVVVEGTRGDQQRCQDPERECSYQELKALRDSGDPIPDYLKMTSDELGELVNQLDTTAATVNAMPTPAEACAAGYVPVSVQNPNMGVHFLNSDLLADGFDPAKPEMLLYGSETAIGVGRSTIGSCGTGGTWEGIDGLQVTGSAFFLNLSDEHPDGYAGPIDQWHVHYNSCANGEFDSTASMSLCEQNAGVWFDLQPNWMVHSYVADGFDNDAGVFAMWNSSAWPLGGAGGSEVVPSGASEIAIDEFSFESTTVEAGESVWFTNNDDVPHVINAGRPSDPLGAFNSPLIDFGTAWELTLDEVGTFDFYCSLHPTMTGQVIVDESE